MTELKHYEWIGAMYCENQYMIIGDFDEFKDINECPECGEAV